MPKPRRKPPRERLGPDLERIARPASSSPRKDRGHDEGAWVSYQEAGA